MKNILSKAIVDLRQRCLNRGIRDFPRLSVVVSVILFLLVLYFRFPNCRIVLQVFHHLHVSERLCLVDRPFTPSESRIFPSRIATSIFDILTTDFSRLTRQISV